MVWVVACGCGTPQRSKSGGAYIFVPNPPIPGVASSVREDAPLSFDDEIGGKWAYDGSSVRDLPGGWRGPAFELYGMKNTATVFFQPGPVQKPGVLYLCENLESSDLREWRSAYIPDDNASHQVLCFTGKDPSMNAVVGLGTPLMLKAVNTRSLFFVYVPLP